MAKYVLSKLVQTVLVLIAVSALIFFTVRLSPSDPIGSIMKGKPVNDEVRQSLMSRFHLDKSPFEQYVIWMGGMLKGDFGESYQYQQPVSRLIGQRAKSTLSLALLSTAIAVAISIPLGVIGAVKAYSALDKAMSFFALIFAGTPTFLIGIIFMLVFGHWLHWFPPMGVGTFRHLVLPASAMAINMVALASRITRQSMLEQLSSDYILTATAKGIKRNRVVIAHALKNALIPVITIASLQIGGMLVGAVLVETVFAMGGLGDLLVNSIQAADYPVVQGVTMLMVVVFMALNMIVDMLYAIIDPRIRLK